MRILVINGPNLNLLGTREPSTYGSETLAELEHSWRVHAQRIGIGIESFQSNHEGTIIDTIHGADGKFNGIVLNAGALSHYSYAIYDALIAVGLPIVEIHISNIHEREPWRRHSVTGEAALAVVQGRGTVGYINAIDHLAAHIAMPPELSAYGNPPDPDRVIDIRTPSRSDSAAIALLIHGGFWRSQWKRDLMSPMATALVRQGWATANIEYRRGPESLTTAATDVESAVDWLRSNGQGRGFDASRIALIGHSAGGYLALKRAHEDAGLLGVVALAPITDLKAMSETRPDDDPVAAAIGAEGGQATNRWSDAALTGEPLSAVHMIHGTSDSNVPPAQSTVYAAAHPDNVSVHQLPGVDHMQLIDPHDGSFATLLSALGELTKS